VEIEDEGCGVPSCELEHIFDRFVRLKSAPEPKLAGSGLGLAICRGIIELHHGRILAEIGSGARGLRVVFEVPAQSPALPAPNLSADALAPATSR
jgi:signal transduction histidine kinase